MDIMKQKLLLDSADCVKGNSKHFVVGRNLQRAGAINIDQANIVDLDEEENINFLELM